MDSLTSLLDMFLALFQILSFFWPLWLVLGIVWAIKLAINLHKSRRLSKSGIAEVDNLDGLDFEKFLGILFKKLGYQVKRTRYRGDYGADLVVQKDGLRIVIQAKRYKRSVGVKAIQEVVAAKAYYKCSKAMVVTNSYYSPEAKKLAKANEVELWDRHDLVNILHATKQTPVAKREISQ